MHPRYCQARSDGVGELTCDPAEAMAAMRDTDGYNATVNLEFDKALALDGSASRPRTTQEKSYRLALEQLRLAWLNNVRIPWLAYYQASLVGASDAYFTQVLRCPEQKAYAAKTYDETKKYQAKLTALTGLKPVAPTPDKPKPPDTSNPLDPIGKGLSSVGWGMMVLGAAVLIVKASSR